MLRLSLSGFILLGKLVIIARMMGFPTWTLWGMGLTGAGALLAILLAYLAQSPRFLARAGVNARLMQLRLRMFIGLALALQLMAFGFFFAGVPLGPQETAVLTPTPPLLPTQTPATAGEIVALTNADETATAVALASPIPTNTRPPATPVTGAFGGPPAVGTATVTAAAIVIEATTTVTTAADVTAVPTATATPSLTPTGGATTTPPATLTNTPTATPTQTPTPTLTPTPIEGKTAVINIGSNGALSLLRVPGGTAVARLLNGDVVIIQAGHANFGGNLWQEVRTVNGILGWAPAAALNYGTED